MKKLLTSALALTLTVGVLAGCGTGNQTMAGDSAGGKAASKAEVLEFYHGYFHDQATWAPAAVMREIYDEFAKQHANESVTFKPIAVENKKDIMKNKVSGGAFPDIIDLAGSPLSQAAMTQGLIYDVKPYIESEGLRNQVGINYSQNDRDGKIYTIHDQLLTMGLWYNPNILKETGAAAPDTWKTWDDFGTAMRAVRKYGAANGIYAYGAGEGSTRIFNAILALSEDGKAMLNGDLTADMVKSKTFSNAFKAVATLDQENGSQNTSITANDFTADFNSQKSGIFFNGVWAAGSFGENANFQPAIFPGNVALSSAGSGITIANNMSEGKTKLALEFLKYMTSESVQKRIFLEVGATPCNSTLNLEELAKESGNSATILLAKACHQANTAQTVVPTMDAVWGSDVNDMITTKLQECAVVGSDINAKLTELQTELIAVLG